MDVRQVLVPLDGSALAAAALPIARLLALSTRAELTLATVLAADAQTGSTRGPAAYLQEVAALERAVGVVVHTTIRLGEPAAAILELVAECETDLIVMATHGRTGFGRMLLGSVADRVLRSSRVAVLLLQPNRHPIERLRTVLVPLDGTPSAAVALATAVPLAQTSGARLVLVRARVPLPMWLYEPTLGLNTGPLIDPMWDEGGRLAAEAYTDGQAERLRRAGLAAEGQGISGQPGAAIVAAAETVDADLIVMSTHVRTGPVRSILGSVAGEVVRRSGSQLRSSRSGRPITCAALRPAGVRVVCKSVRGSFAIPLLASAIRRADRVALAMDSHAFGTEIGRTYFHEQRFGRADLAFISGP
jgi:nucleotide-binding universal stress UspA family protein